LVVADFAGRSVLVLSAAIGTACTVGGLYIVLAHALTSRLSHSTLRYQILSITSSLCVIVGFDSRVLPYLDLLAFWLALAAAAWRIGCLLRGCCHGRPCRFGVKYPDARAFPGIAPYYAGIRLFPVQALEAIWNGLVSALVLRALFTSPSGGGFVTWVLGY